MRSTLTRLLRAGQTERLRRRSEPHELGAVTVGVGPQRCARRGDRIREARRTLELRVLEQQSELRDCLLEPEVGRRRLGCGFRDRLRQEPAAIAVRGLVADLYEPELRGTRR